MTDIYINMSEIINEQKKRNLLPLYESAPETVFPFFKNVFLYCYFLHFIQTLVVNACVLIYLLPYFLYLAPSFVCLKI